MPTALLGAQTASLYGWRTIRGLRQQRSCILRYATAWTQIAYGLLDACSKLFRKSTWISFVLRGYFLKSPRPSLPLKRAPPLFPSPFPLRGQGMCQPPYSVLKPLRYMVGGPSEVFASSGAAVCGMRPHGHESLRGCLVLAVHLEFLQQGNSNNKAVV